MGCPANAVLVPRPRTGKRVQIDHPGSMHAHKLHNHDMADGTLPDVAGADYEYATY
jgi:hypothetical protein